MEKLFKENMQIWSPEFGYGEIIKKDENNHKIKIDFNGKTKTLDYLKDKIYNEENIIKDKIALESFINSFKNKISLIVQESENIEISDIQSAKKYLTLLYIVFKNVSNTISDIFLSEEKLQMKILVNIFKHYEEEEIFDYIKNINSFITDIFLKTTGEKFKEAVNILIKNTDIDDNDYALKHIINFFANKSFDIKNFIEKNILNDNKDSEKNKLLSESLNKIEKIVLKNIRNNLYDIYLENLFNLNAENLKLLFFFEQFIFEENILDKTKIKNKIKEKKYTVKELIKIVNNFEEIDETARSLSSNKYKIFQKIKKDFLISVFYSFIINKNNEEIENILTKLLNTVQNFKNEDNKNKIIDVLNEQASQISQTSDAFYLKRIFFEPYDNITQYINKEIISNYNLSEENINTNIKTLIMLLSVSYLTGKINTDTKKEIQNQLLKSISGFNPETLKRINFNILQNSIFFDYTFGILCIQENFDSFNFKEVIKRIKTLLKENAVNEKFFLEILQKKSADSFLLLRKNDKYFDQDKIENEKKQIIKEKETLLKAIKTIDNLTETDFSKTEINTEETINVIKEVINKDVSAFRYGSVSDIYLKDTVFSPYAENMKHIFSFLRKFLTDENFYTKKNNFNYKNTFNENFLKTCINFINKIPYNNIDEIDEKQQNILKNMKRILFYNKDSKILNKPDYESLFKEKEEESIIIFLISADNFTYHKNNNGSVFYNIADFMKNHFTFKTDFDKKYFKILTISKYFLKNDIYDNKDRDLLETPKIYSLIEKNNFMLNFILTRNYFFRILKADNYSSITDSYINSKINSEILSDTLNIFVKNFKRTVKKVSEKKENIQYFYSLFSELKNEINLKNRYSFSLLQNKKLYQAKLSASFINLISYITIFNQIIPYSKNEDNIFGSMIPYDFFNIKWGKNKDIIKTVLIDSGALAGNLLLNIPFFNITTENLEDEKKEKEYLIKSFSNLIKSSFISKNSAKKEYIAKIMTKINEKLYFFSYKTKEPFKENNLYEKINTGNLITITKIVNILEKEYGIKIKKEKNKDISIKDI